MSRLQQLATSVVVLGLFAMMCLWVAYTCFRINVPSMHIAVLTRKVGADLQNGQEIAPSAEHKGVQQNVLTEGRYFYNPYSWDWQVIPMVEVPRDKLGVRIRMVGTDLPYGETIAWHESQKGIVPGVLKAGRYPINPWIERVELHDPIVVPAGFKGVVTLLAAQMPSDPNQLMVEAGKRGVQRETLDPGTYYINSYVTRINLVDCRSQRFNLATEDDMGFPSRDGFWVSLDGIIEFHVQPKKAAEVYVTYNDQYNGEDIDEEIIKKVILPNARAFCRLRGSNHAGRDFISGDTRIKFQEDFAKAMKEACDPHGVEVLQSLITKIRPPQAIAGPIRDREVSQQRLGQYTQQIEQMKSEQKLAIEQQLVKQKQVLVGADQEVVKITIKAKEQQAVAVTKANEKLQVAKFRLEAANDEAAAITARGKAVADVVRFENEAAAAGWREAVKAFGGDGNEYARYTLFQKLAPSFQTIMANTQNSPLMKIFEEYSKPTSGRSVPRREATVPSRN